MMRFVVTEVKTIAFKGIEIADVIVQIHIQSGIPTFTIVGLPDKAIAESKERIRSALANLGVGLPAKKITVNLAPADLLKEGSHFDLPIILGILQHMNLINQDALDNYYTLGEIALDGRIMSVPGILPASIHANKTDKGIICPSENGSEAAWSGNNLILAPMHISNVISHFKGEQKLCKPEPLLSKNIVKHNLDFADVVGQESAKRALEIAAAGNHNLLMIGPPGSGKSMLAARLTTILPELNSTEILETNMILSIAGKIKNGSLSNIRPFRSPHHSCSNVAMTGGGHGKRIMPGEISLAHNGVLFLDELPEFQKPVIESLRQPIESERINIARANAHISYPSKFQLIVAMNPCKCGYLSDPVRACRKAPVCSEDYLNKISGPIYDRIDIFVEVPEIKPSELEKYQNVPRETSNSIAQRIIDARILQSERYAESSITTNSQLSGKLIEKFIIYNPKVKILLHRIAEKLNLSMRGYDRLQKVARTIADLAHEEKISEQHLLEAANYRLYRNSILN